MYNQLKMERELTYLGGRENTSGECDTAVKARTIFG